MNAVVILNEYRRLFDKALHILKVRREIKIDEENARLSLVTLQREPSLMAEVTVAENEYDVGLIWHYYYFPAHVLDMSDQEIQAWAESDRRQEQERQKAERKRQREEEARRVEAEAFETYQRLKAKYEGKQETL